MERAKKTLNAWTLVGLGALALGACVSEPGDDGGDGAGGTSAGGTGGAGTDGSGGVVMAGGTGGTTPGTGGAASGGLGGLGGLGGAAAACSLPFEGGECDAAIPVYFHNPETHRCEPAVYGGCGGNENRFATYAECESACDVEASGAACEVEGIVYPDGYTPVHKPASCDTCTCSDGALTDCAGVDCVEPCPEGTVFSTDCAVCGPVDNCEVVRTGCLPACGDQDDCAESGGFCNQGACRNLCG